MKDIQFEDLPQTLPIFPLTGVLLLPRGNLPLNIFEPRYLAMIDEAMHSHRLIGMIQPQANQERDSKHIYDTGCAGRITGYEETEDGRYVINLTGVCRFKVVEEKDLHASGFRQIHADWEPFRYDLLPTECFGLDRDRLIHVLEDYFNLHGISCDWDAVKSALDERLVTSLSMVCPLDAGEKQALLEAGDCKSRADMFMAMLEMAIKSDNAPGSSDIHH